MNASSTSGHECFFIQGPNTLEIKVEVIHLASVGSAPLFASKQLIANCYPAHRNLKSRSLNVIEFWKCPIGVVQWRHHVCLPPRILELWIVRSNPTMVLSGSLKMGKSVNVMTIPLHVINLISYPKYAWHGIQCMYCFEVLRPWALFPPNFFFTFHGFIVLLDFRFLWFCPLSPKNEQIKNNNRNNIISGVQCVELEILCQTETKVLQIWAIPSRAM
jgi:hypothetical protein